MISDALAALGAAVVVVGVGMVSIPAAVIVGGLLVIVAAWRLS